MRRISLASDPGRTLLCGHIACAKIVGAATTGTQNMDLSDPVNLAEDLLERVAQGNLTSTETEVLAWRLGDAYLIAGNLADFARMKDDPVVIRALDLRPTRCGPARSTSSPNGIVRNPKT